MTQKSSDHYQANIDLLKKNHPQTWKLITENPPKPTGKITLSPTGLPNLCLEEKDEPQSFIHLANDPKAEIPQFMKLIPPSATGFVAMFGMGLGYTPIAILKERPTISNLAIFEADAGIFRQALQAMDLSPILTDSRVILCIGQDYNITEKMAPYSRTFLLEAIHTLRHIPTYKLHPEIYKKLDDDFFQFANKQNVTGGTSIVFGPLFMKNRLSQLTTIHHNHFLDRLHNCLTDTPAILVAGGPSLDKNIHLLKQLKDQTVIFAADTVLPTLNRHKITPHFVSSIDPQNVTYEKFADLPDKLGNTSLICPPWVTPKVPKYIQTKEVFWLFSQISMELWLNELLGGQLSFQGAGTVAQMNLYAAILLGCSPIIFIGQDLAYSEGKDHADNTALPSVDLAKAQLQNKKEAYMVKGVNGGEVPTTRAFLSMKQTFEDIIRSNPTQQYINSTEGGAHLEGTAVMPLQESIDQYCLNTESNVNQLMTSILEKAKRPTLPPLIKELSATKTEIRKLQGYIEKSNVLAKQILKALQSNSHKTKPYSQIEHIPANLRKKIAKMEKFHKQLDQSKIWTILHEITLDGLRDAVRLEAELSRIEKDPKQYKKWLSGNMTRLLAVNNARSKALDLFLPELLQTLDHLQVEKKLIQANQEKDAVWQKELDLALHYLTSRDIKIARPILENLLQSHPDSAEILFALGKISSLQKNQSKAKEYFSQAIKLDPDNIEKVRSFKIESAEEYLQFAARYTQIDKITCRTMLLKGLALSSESPGILASIRRTVALDIKNMERMIELPLQDDTTRIINFWHTQLEELAPLVEILSPEQVASFYYLHGRLMDMEESFQKAIESYTKALTLTTTNADIHLGLTNAFFNIDDMGKGVEHLAQAVAIEPSHARTWEELGDSLKDTEQYTDALAAYEQCFISQPENIELIKKIGDCYLASGQEEAAREAYTQYKNVLTQTG